MDNDEIIRRGIKAVEWMRIDTGTDAFIAGGAVRDWLLGSPIKDVDVWVLDEHAKVRDWIACNTVQSGLSLASADNPFYEADPGARTYEIDNVDEARIAGVDLNLIYVSGAKNIEHVVSEFDFGICRAWLSSFGTPRTTAEFERDDKAKTLTLLHPHNASRIDKRIARLTEKFPGWTVVRPEAA